ncbi:Msr family ABC-F type ribosomal protection protein [Gracilibacillus salinarum]|uniref:ABC-F type ribosomal protection protein n=1 Tax=Gracilibacillus salinarum TaxID=2932255 RepID=A0ABY4GSA3_9BACI|nr:ABC-F type ribosomal protection protein [Gracilibacillus salinarum]UOQ87267.1 ABC-F type ribosomal protection protein [Gracilibacillus salinarum]
MEQISFELEQIEINYLDKEIMKVERLAVHQFDRIGIVGKNGAGKSTILRLLAGKVMPTKGTVHRHVSAGYFEQMEGPDTHQADPKLLGKLHVPNQYGLSGGEQTRLKLAQLFTNYHESLLIDEPTTHLDEDGIKYLLSELRYYYGALVLISHDRAVLDELVTTIWEVNNGRVNVYSGNYSDYIAQKELERDQQRQAHEQYLKEKSRLEKAAQEKMNKASKIARAASMPKKESKAKANRMFETKSKATSQKALQKAAKSIEHRMEKLEAVEAVQDEKPIMFRQSKVVELHNKFPIMADCFTLTANGQVLLEEVNFQLPLGKKIAITGPNGSGKSTLLHHFASNQSGLTISPKAKIGYFRQMSYQFRTDETVWQFVKNRSDYEDGLLRSVLHAMQLVGTDLQKKVKALSGGEAIRLQLSQLFLGEYNILLLDEPTNFLDIHAVEALERFIKAYQGTIIFVTHDQMFIKNVADIQFQINAKQIERL